jgi:HEAT repeat protein
MRSIFSWIWQFDPGNHVILAIFGLAIAVCSLLGFIFIRRASRRHYFRRRDERTLAIRKRWDGIVSGSVPPEAWRFDSLDRDIVEAILLDRLDVAPSREAERLMHCLRSSGLLDIRIYEASHCSGWQRRRALVCLGRMHAAEAIPALAEALGDPDAKVRLAALRGLGSVGLPEASAPILERVVLGDLQVPAAPLQNALLNCCRLRPSLLLSYVLRAEDSVRPLLARVLGEVASQELGEDLLLLASDPLADVRASAARALGEAAPALGLSALANLVHDEEWFVRLRAVAALGRLQDAQSIPLLVEGLCDSNRHVRLRSASALARFDAQLEEIFGLVRQSHDRYAMQAFVAELERSGALLHLVESLPDDASYQSTEGLLLTAFHAGAERFLVGILAHHVDLHVRIAVARVLARSGEIRLIPTLEQLAASASSWRGQCVTRWVTQQLRKSPALQQMA